MDRPITYTAGVFIHIIKDTFANRPGRRYHYKKRLPSRALGLLHYLVKIPVFDTVKLVHDNKVAVQSIQRIAVLSKRLHLREGKGKIKVAFPLLYHLQKIRALLYHVVSFIKYNPRLVFLARDAVDFRARFVICNQHVKRDSA